MREIRPSGSVEGVMGNHHSYSDFGQVSAGSQPVDANSAGSRAAASGP
jgi:hypothetical protein